MVESSVRAQLGAASQSQEVFAQSVLRRLEAQEASVRAALETHYIASTDMLAGLTDIR